MNVELTEDFDEKRKLRENDDFICNLIRNDSIDEYISYINQNNLLLDANIEQSIFEINSFLLETQMLLFSVRFKF